MRKLTTVLLILAAFASTAQVPWICDYNDTIMLFSKAVDQCTDFDDPQTSIGLIDEFVARRIPGARAYRFNMHTTDYIQDITGECDRIFIDFYDQPNEKGVYFYFHGGGFTRGAASFIQEDSEVARLLELGYDVYVFEYPRGWDYYQAQELSGGDIYQTTAEVYRSQDRAARLAITYCKQISERLYRKRLRNYKKPIYVTGNSAGGAIAAHLRNYVKWKVPADGFVVGYGGASVEDTVYWRPSRIPVVYHSGAYDPLVPNRIGYFYYAVDSGLAGVGNQWLHEKNLRSKRDRGSLSVLTCAAGHSWGVWDPRRDAMAWTIAEEWFAEIAQGERRDCSKTYTNPLEARELETVFEQPHCCCDRPQNRQDWIDAGGGFPTPTPPVGHTEP